MAIKLLSSVAMIIPEDETTRPERYRYAARMALRPATQRVGSFGEPNIYSGEIH